MTEKITKQLTLEEKTELLQTQTLLWQGHHYLAVSYARRLTDYHRRGYDILDFIDEYRVFLDYSRKKE